MRNALIATAAALVAFLALAALLRAPTPSQSQEWPPRASDGRVLVDRARFNADVRTLIGAARDLNTTIIAVVNQPSAIETQAPEIQRETDQMRAAVRRMENYRVAERTLDELRDRLIAPSRDLARASDDFARALQERNGSAAIDALSEWERARSALSRSGREDDVAPTRGDAVTVGVI